ncbi:hypothetical protein PHYC_00278 [Phycisphaerales bacterium]|nr:hypothetical protein PHYC_00278 [Phycisphaerales bacterium]
MAGMTRTHSLAPLFIRVALGLTFIWAGMGKLFAEFPVSGEDAARLANWGQLEKAKPKTPPEEPAKVPEKPTDIPKDRPVPKEPLPETEKPGGRSGMSDPTRAAIVLAGFQNEYAAADFAEPVKTRRVNGIALMIYKAANPQADAEGNKPFPLWPPAMATGRWPVYLAWAVAITELAGGGLLLVGLLARLAAAGVAGVMLGAMWLTEFGPAIQSGKTILGFIPDRGHDAVYAIALSPNGYVSLLWQLALLSMAVAVMALGPGSLALDNAMRPRASAPKPAPKPAA